MTEEEIEKAIMKQLRMKGLLLADVKLIREMDKDIEGSSMIIPATVNKDGSLGKNTSAATMEQFKLLRKYVRNFEEFVRGNYEGKCIHKSIQKEGNHVLQVLQFLPVCQFDTTMKENTFKCFTIKRMMRYGVLWRRRKRNNAFK